MMVATLAFSVPAAASNAHRLAHVEAPVIAGQHHHHGDSSSDIEVHDEGSNEASDGDRKDKSVGHSHAGAATGELLTADTLLPTITRSTADHPHAWSVHRLTTRGWTPHQRPPRTA